MACICTCAHVFWGRKRAFENQKIAIYLTSTKSMCYDFTYEWIYPLYTMAVCHWIVISPWDLMLIMINRCPHTDLDAWMKSCICRVCRLFRNAHPFYYWSRNISGGTTHRLLMAWFRLPPGHMTHVMGGRAGPLSYNVPLIFISHGLLTR